MKQHKLELNLKFQSNTFLCGFLVAPKACTYSIQYKGMYSSGVLERLRSSGIGGSHSLEWWLSKPGIISFTIQPCKEFANKYVFFNIYNQLLLLLFCAYNIHIVYTYPNQFYKERPSNLSFIPHDPFQVARHHLSSVWRPNASIPLIFCASFRFAAGTTAFVIPHCLLLSR